jgi:hypothetical protein
MQMAHFDDFPALRTHRTYKYGSFTVLGTIAKLHSPAKALNCLDGQ